MLKIGAITIGQSPRTDLIPEMEEIFYDDVANLFIFIFITRGSGLKKILQ